MKRQFLAFALVLFFTATSFEQVFKTNLKITVRNELGNIEEDVRVQLYENEEDYRNEINPITDVQLTNKKGEVKFKDLEPKAYYILAKKGEKNNWGGGEITDILEEGKLNKVTIVIE